MGAIQSQNIEDKLSSSQVKEGTYNDTIVAKIADNPEPVEFAIAAIGALPKAPSAWDSRIALVLALH